MKVAIFFALVATAYAGNLGLGLAPGLGLGLGAGLGYGGVIAAPAVAKAAIVSTGASTRSRADDGLGNYRFAYNEQGATGGSSRAEAGNAYGGVVGSYSLNAADGRKRIVNYVADGHGFRANVQTNEPGTAPSIPANAPTNAGLVRKAVIAAPVIQKTVVAAPAITKVAAAPLGLGLGAGLIGAPGLGLGAGILGAPAYGAGILGANAYGAGILGANAYGAGILGAPAGIIAAPVASKVAINHAAPVGLGYGAGIAGW